MRQVMTRVLRSSRLLCTQRVAPGVESFPTTSPQPHTCGQRTLLLTFLGGFTLGSWASNHNSDVSPTTTGEVQVPCCVDAGIVQKMGLAPMSFLQKGPSATKDGHHHSDNSNRSSMPLAGCLSPYFIADAAAKAAPAVVNILVQQPGTMPVGSSGSGFIISPDGTILTNAHVVADALPSFSSSPQGSATNKRGGPIIAVTLQDGRAFDADLLNYDSVSDLAVLKIRTESSLALPTVKLGSSAGLRVGEWVVALGSPLHLTNSVTAGIISCVDRKAVELGLAGLRTEYIQTDASINRGSSGGPLVNLAGEVIGVSCMKAVAADGVSFAIPIDAAEDVVRQLMEHGRVVRPFIGVKLLQLNPHNAEHFRRRDQTFPKLNSGVLVPHVLPGSPADRAGLRQGDVIVGFDGLTGATVTTSELIRLLTQSIGRPLEVTVIRGDEGGTTSTVVLRIVAQELGQERGKN